MTTFSPEVIYLMGAGSGLLSGLLIWATYSFTQVTQPDQK